MRLLCFMITLSFFTSFLARSQDSNSTKNVNDLGLSVQFYPAGIIPTINLEPYLNDNTSLLFRLGANFTDRQDFSEENDVEEGEGFGITTGYRKHFPLSRGKLIAGFNLDFWNLWIDWRDDIGSAVESSGTTYIFIVQPWLEVGYFLDFKNSSSQLGITLGFGREINLITDGEDVEQDFIGSISLQYMFRL